MEVIRPLNSEERKGFSYRRGRWRCLFWQIGQCESLGTWDRQQVQSPRLLFMPQPDNLDNKHTGHWR